MQLPLATPSAQIVNFTRASTSACTSATESVERADMTAKNWLMMPIFAASTPMIPALANVFSDGKVFVPS